MDTSATPRLTAERLDDRHLESLVLLHLDEAVMRHLGGVRTPAATGAYLADNMAHWHRHGFGLWALRTRDGRFAGRAGLRHVSVDGAGEVEVAYTFRRALWGRGLAGEIAVALVGLGLTRLNLPSLVGIASIGNLASRRVLEKAGFAGARRTVYRGSDVVILRRMRPDPA